MEVSNNGKDSTIFRPVFGMRIEHPDYPDNVLMSAISGEGKGKKNPFALTSNGFTINMGDNEDQGERFRVESLLPSAGSVGYVRVAGGDSVTIKLVGTAPLGKRGKSLVDMHATKLLKARVLGITIHGDHVWSPLTQFSLTVDDDAKKQIELARP